MASYEKDDVPMLSDAQAQLSNENEDSRFRAYLSRTRSAISIPMNPMDTFQNEPNLVGFTGPLRSQRNVPMIQMSGPIYTSGRGETNFRHHQGATGKNIADPKTENFPSFKRMDQHHWSEDKYARKNEHLLRSGQLGLCNDPYCTTCPTYFKPAGPAQQKHSKASVIFDLEFHNVLYGDAKGWARKFVSFLGACIPVVMNPHTKVVQWWSKFFAIICLLAISVDPLYFFLLSMQQDNKCVNIDWRMTTVLIILRSTTDFMYLLNILLQFRLAYIAPDSKVVGAGQLVDEPKKIAWHYFSGYFLVDLFNVLPLPQIIASQLLKDFVEQPETKNAIIVLQALVLGQYILRLYRFLPLLIGVSPIGFVFETAKANFLINLLTIMLSGHVVGSCWYLFALQRLNRCLHNACLESNTMDSCLKFIDCGHGNNFTELDSKDKWTSWINNDNATACFTEEDPYGIYVKAVNLSAQSSVVTRYVYSLSWGFQQISTLAGNLEPSYSAGEAFFTMVIIGLGLLLFAFLIGNIQNFLQALDRRRLEMTLRRRDFEQWMSHRRLPEELRRKVHEAERYNWAATRGVNEEMLLENLPEDLQRDIRRHLFKFVKEVWIFALMDNNVLDAICERLKPKIYIKGGEILYRGGLVEKMVFIVRGKLESIGEDGTIIPLFEGNVCGEELLAWCLDHSSVSKDGKKIKFSGQRLLSSRTVRCLTNVEAFSLHAEDLEEVTELFSRNLRNPRVQAAIRYESPYWRGLAATCIQVAWRYRQKRLKRSSTSQSNHPKY